MRPRSPSPLSPHVYGNVYVLCIETFKFRLLEQFEPIIIQLRVIAQSRARMHARHPRGQFDSQTVYSYLFVQISRSHNYASQENGN